MRSHHAAIVLVGLALLPAGSLQAQQSFRDFLDKDREAYRRFVNPTSTTARAVSPPRVDAAEWAANKARAEAALALYTQTQQGLARLREMVESRKQREAELYRFPVPTWSTTQIAEWRAIENYKRDINAERERIKPLTDTWNRDYSQFGRWTEFGRTYTVKTYNPSDAPGTATIKEYDLVKYRIGRLWPTGPQDPPPERVQVVRPTPQPPAWPPSWTAPEPVYEEPLPEAPKPEWPAPGVPPPPDPVLASVTSWEHMTVEGRHEALKKSDPAAWDAVREALLSGDPALVATATAAMSRPPSPPIPGAKAWEQMSAQERHDALKRNDPAAWKALQEALESGDPQRLVAVLEALSTPAGAALTPEIIAIAYWNGYNLGLMEQATQPAQSMLEATAQAYVHPTLMAAVREGYADARAGKPAQHALPATVAPPPDR